jgi:hypothetical protein
VQQDVVRQLWSVTLLPLWQGHQWLWSFLVSHFTIRLPWYRTGIPFMHDCMLDLTKYCTNLPVAGMDVRSLTYVSLAM